MPALGQQRWISSICLWGLIAGLVGCAKVGDPLPPEITVPEPVTDLLVYQQGPNILTFSFNLPPGELREFEVLRDCGSGEFEVFSRLPIEDLRRVPPLENSRALDLIIHEREVCSYSIRVRNRQGTRSARSAGVRVEWGEAPACPEELRAEVFPDHLTVEWQPPSATASPVVAYLVDSRYLVSEPRIRIEDFSFGEPRSILVQSVSQRGNPMVLSGSCPPLRVTPQDTFPPPSPEGLRAVRVRDGVQLVWDPVAAGDLAGYRVYRLEGTDRQVAAALVAANQFLDRGAPTGVELQYEVTALDRAGNESAASELAEVATQ